MPAIANNSLPPPELALFLPKELPMERRIGVWAERLDTCEELLLAGLRRQIGPDGDLQAAYREWYAEHMKEHDRAMLHMVEEFNRRSRTLGR